MMASYEVCYFIWGRCCFELIHEDDEGSDEVR